MHNYPTTNKTRRKNRSTKLSNYQTTKYDDMHPKTAHSRWAKVRRRKEKQPRKKGTLKNMSNECGIKVKILNKFLFLFSHISCMFLLLSLSPWKLSEAHIYSGYAVKFALLPPYCLVCCCCIPHPPRVDRDRLDSFCCQKEQHTAHKIISHKVQSTHESAEPKTPSRTTKQRRKCDDESSSSFLSPYIFLVNLSQSVDCSNRCFWSAQHTKNGDGNSRNKRKTQIKIALQPPLSPCHMFRPREKKTHKTKRQSRLNVSRILVDDDVVTFSSRPQRAYTCNRILPSRFSIADKVDMQQQRGEHKAIDDQLNVLLCEVFFPSSSRTKSFRSLLPAPVLDIRM